MEALWLLHIWHDANVTLRVNHARLMHFQDLNQPFHDPSPRVANVVARDLSQYNDIVKMMFLVRSRGLVENFIEKLVWQARLSTEEM